MRTIEKILIKNKVTEKQLIQCEADGICNGCGGKGGINVSKILDRLIHLSPLFDISKGEKLLYDLELICDIHDIMYYRKEGFFKSNWILAENIFQLLHWTKLRYLIATVVLICTTIFGFKYYYK